ncbi:MAG: adenylosuccinate lyase [Bacteroidia bacterium]|nr:adenylosuccinate lyase [Bacteroidia bacterium]MDW8089628.1 adenylosuccinate lyase [Bacteroidia bacterium]
MADEIGSLSPLDGRYLRYVADLRPYLSEAAFFRYRLEVETEYFAALVELPLPPLADFPKSYLTQLRQAFLPFGKEVVEELRRLEAQTRHDVKAIEYFLRQRWQALLPPAYHKALAFIHFGLTSQDVNTSAQAQMFRDALKAVYLPAVERLIQRLHAQAYAWRELAMLGFTHGQPASPTTLGKELYVFVVRLEAEYAKLQAQVFWTKLGGAVGNLNAHYATFPEIDWLAFFDRLAERLGLRRFPCTTQILPYERWAEIWDNLRRLQSICTDLAQDLWLYAHRGYLRLEKAEGQIGSSTMPHKVNPTLLELAEGNLRLSNALWSFLSEKLPVSRLQRDLTDSTLLRNLGVALGHGLVGIRALIESLDQLVPVPTAMEAELQAHPEVVAEAWQTLQRKAGNIYAYEEALQALRAGTFEPPFPPQTYVGYAPYMVPPPSR